MIEYDFDKAKEEYRELCRDNETIQIYIKDWYLDAACQNVEDWKVILVKENGKIMAAFPFQHIKKKGLWSISNAFQVARGGIWIDYGNRNTNSKKESFTAKIIEEIITHLPYYDVFNITFDARFCDWQQFYYYGFEQTTYYSYIIRPERFNSKNDIIDSFQSNRRYEIRRGMDVYSIDKSVEGEEFWEYFVEKLSEKGKKPHFNKLEFLKLLEGIFNNNGGVIYTTRNKEEKIMAANVVFYDSMRAYEQFIAYDINTKINAHPLLDYICIKDTIESGRIFDFEGSMLRGSAGYLTHFNAEKEPYFSIKKYSEKFKRRILASSVKNTMLNFMRKAGEK